MLVAIKAVFPIIYFYISNLYDGKLESNHNVVKHRLHEYIVLAASQQTNFNKMPQKVTLIMNKTKLVLIIILTNTEF